MKTQTKGFTKKLCAFLVVATLLIFGTMLTSSAEGQAEGSGLGFVDGAYIRLKHNEESSGIRFAATIDESVYEKLFDKTSLRDGAELGMIIVPDFYVTDYLAYQESCAEDASLPKYEDYLTYFKEVKGKSKDSITRTYKYSNLIPLEDGGYQILGSLVSILTKNLDTEFRAIVYYSLDNCATYTFCNESSPRSVSGTSIRAIEADDDLNIYTDTELALLYKYANGHIARVLYDAGKDSHLTKLEYAGTDANDFYTVETVVDADGNEWFKYTINEDVEGERAIMLSYPTDGLELSLYDYVYFKVMSDSETAECDLANEDLSHAIGGWNKLVQNVPFDVCMYLNGSNAQFFEAAAGGYNLVTKGLKAGESVYLSSFTAHGTKSIDRMITKLPSEGFINVAEKLDVSDVRKLHDALSSSAISEIKNLKMLEASEVLPLTIYDASITEGDDADFKKFSVFGNDIMPSSAEISSNGSMFIFNPTAHIDLGNGLNGTVYSFDLTDKISLDIYDYVHFTLHLTTVSEDAKILFGKVTLVDNAPVITYPYYDENGNIQYTEDEFSSSSVFSLVSGDNEICLSAEIFKELSNGNGFFLITGFDASEPYIYASDFSAVGSSSLIGMIERLDKEGLMTRDDQQKIEETRKFYDLYDSYTQKNQLENTIASTTSENGTHTFLQDLQQSEGREYNLIDTSSSENVGVFEPIALENDGDGWKAEVTSVQENGRSWFKFTVTQKGDRGLLAYKVNIGKLDIDLSAYQMVTYSIKSDAGIISSFYQESTESSSSINIAGFGIAYDSGDGDGNENTVNLTVLDGSLAYCTFTNRMTTLEVVPSTGDPENPGLIEIWDQYYVVFTELDVGESIYFSDFTCYNANTLLNMIEKLPSADSVTSLDYDAINKVVDYNNKLGDILLPYSPDSDISAEDFPGFDIDDVAALRAKLIACLDAISDILVPTVNLSSPGAQDSFTVPSIEDNEVTGWKGDITIIEDENNEKWVQFTVEELGVSGNVYFDIDLSTMDITTAPYYCYTIKCSNPDATISLDASGLEVISLNNEDISLSGATSISKFDDGMLVCANYTYDVLLSYLPQTTNVNLCWNVSGLKPGDTFLVSSVFSYSVDSLKLFFTELDSIDETNIDELLANEEKILRYAAYTGPLTSSELSEFKTAKIGNLLKALINYYHSEILTYRTVGEDSSVSYAFSKTVINDDGTVSVAYLKDAVASLHNAFDIYEPLYYNGMMNVPPSFADMLGSNAIIETEREIAVYIASILPEVTTLADEEQIRLAREILREFKYYPEETGSNPGGTINGVWTKYAAVDSATAEILRRADEAYLALLIEGASAYKDSPDDLLLYIDWLRSEYDAIIFAHYPSISDDYPELILTEQGEANNAAIGNLELNALQLRIDALTAPEDVSSMSIEEQREILEVRNTWIALYELGIDMTGLDVTNLEEREIELASYLILCLSPIDEIDIDDEAVVIRLYSYFMALSEYNSSLPLEISREVGPRLFKLMSEMINDLPTADKVDAIHITAVETINSYITMLNDINIDAEYVLDNYTVFAQISNAFNFKSEIYGLSETSTSKLISKLPEIREYYEAAIASGVDPAQLAIEYALLAEYELMVLDSVYAAAPDSPTTSTTSQNNIMAYLEWYDYMVSLGYDVSAYSTDKIYAYYYEYLRNYADASSANRMHQYFIVDDFDTDYLSRYWLDYIDQIVKIYSLLEAEGKDVSAYTEEYEKLIAEVYRLCLEHLDIIETAGYESEYNIKFAVRLYKEMLAAGEDVSPYTDRLTALINEYFYNIYLEPAINGITYSEEYLTVLEELYTVAANIMNGGFSLSDSNTSMMTELFLDVFDLKAENVIPYLMIGDDGYERLMDAKSYKDMLESKGLTLHAEGLDIYVQLLTFIPEVLISELPSLEDITAEDMPEFEKITDIMILAMDEGVDFTTLYDMEFTEAFLLKLERCIELYGIENTSENVIGLYAYCGTLVAKVYIGELPALEAITSDDIDKVTKIYDYLMMGAYAGLDIEAMIGTDTLLGFQDKYYYCSYLAYTEELTPAEEITEADGEALASISQILIEMVNYSSVDIVNTDLEGLISIHDQLAAYEELVSIDMFTEEMKLAYTYTSVLKDILSLPELESITENDLELCLDIESRMTALGEAGFDTEKCFGESLMYELIPKYYLAMYKSAYSLLPECDDNVDYTEWITNEGNADNLYICTEIYVMFYTEGLAETCITDVSKYEKAALYSLPTLISTLPDPSEVTSGYPTYEIEMIRCMYELLNIFGTSGYDKIDVSRLLVLEEALFGSAGENYYVPDGESGVAIAD